MFVIIAGGGRTAEYLATLLLSQGVPMVLAGDECRRTQRVADARTRLQHELSTCQLHGYLST